jgi:hypothetical protein
LAPGLAGANHLEDLDLVYCKLGNIVGDIVPNGQVDRSWTLLSVWGLASMLVRV